MPENDPILRIEYEARTSLTQSEISRMIAKFDVLSAKFDTLTISMNSQISVMQTDMTKQMDNLKTDKWKYIATSLISFITGGGALGLIEFLLLRK